MSDSSVTSTESVAVLRGRTLVLLSGVFMSLGGLFIRSIESAGEWQILFWRSIGVMLALLAFIALRNKGGFARLFRDSGAKGVIAGLCLASGFICFVFSMTHTTVANTLFMLSAGPFIAAIVGKVVLGEAVRRATWIAMAFAALGIAIMVGESLAVGGLFGNLMGLGAATGFAGYTVALRGGRGTDMMPATCLAGLFAAIAAGIMLTVYGSGFAVTPADMTVCLAYGAIAIGVALIIYTIGARHIAAAEVVLLSLTEVVLGPIWVWLVFAETPSLPTLLGGAVLLAAIAGRALSGMRRRPPPMGVV